MSSTEVFKVCSQAEIVSFNTQREGEEEGSGVKYRLEFREDGKAGQVDRVIR